MITPIKTIWKYGIVFSNDKIELEQYVSRTDGKGIWHGELDMLPMKYADEVAEIHPRFEQYYADAMMPLYKTYNTIRSGTENSTIALASLRTRKELELKPKLKYIFIWKIID